MKMRLFIVLAIFVSVGFGMEIPALPMSEYADAEVSTNFTFAIANSGGCRLVFSLGNIRVRAYLHSSIDIVGDFLL